MLEQLTSMARILSRHEIALPERAQGAERDVLQVANGCGNQVKGSGLKRWRLIFHWREWRALVLPRDSALAGTNEFYEMLNFRETGNLFLDLCQRIWNGKALTEQNAVRLF